MTLNGGRFSNQIENVPTVGPGMTSDPLQFRMENDVQGVLILGNAPQTIAFEYGGDGWARGYFETCAHRNS